MHESFLKACSKYKCLLLHFFSRLDMDEESIRKAAKEALGCDIEQINNNMHNSCEGSTEKMADLELSEEIMDLNISDDSELVESDYLEVLTVNDVDDKSFEEKRAETLEQKPKSSESKDEDQASEMKEVDSNKNKICDKDVDTTICDSNSSNAAGNEGRSTSADENVIDDGKSDDADEKTNSADADCENADDVGAGTPGESSGRAGGDHVQSFNEFQFWRPPFPSLDVDFDLVDGAPYQPNVISKSEDQCGTVEDEVGGEIGSGDRARDDEVKIHTASVNTFIEEGETVDNIGSTHILGEQINDVPMAVVDGIAKGK